MSERIESAVLGELETESEVTPEALDRALLLLAKWGLRHGQKVLEEAGLNPKNLVTGLGIKGYGAHEELN